MDDMAMPGLYATVMRDGGINPDAWRVAVDTKAFVGICPSCKAPMHGQRPDTQKHITWFTARCTACGHEVHSPGGRTVPRNSRSWH